jgi:hypothetical protein
MASPTKPTKAAVKPRFVRWVIDLLNRPFDQAWLDYQWEILEAMRPRLQGKGLAPDEIERLHAAWCNAVILSLALWRRPYACADLW